MRWEVKAYNGPFTGSRDCVRVRVDPLPGYGLPFLGRRAAGVDGWVLLNGTPLNPVRSGRKQP